MESIGKFLREAREQRALNVDQIARETNISRHYLVALEEDHFEEFPAEPYVIGFLRNYSDYLGLDTADLISRYRTLKIQEQPAPLEELIRKPQEFPAKIILFGAGILIAVVAILAVAPSVFSFLGSLPKSAAASPEARQPKVYTLAAQDKTMTQRLYVGDSFSVVLSGSTVSLPLTAINNNTALGAWKFHLGDALFLDLDGDGVQDLRVFLKDEAVSDPSRGAEFAIERLVPTAASPAAGAVSVGDEMKPGLPAPGSAAGNSEKLQPIVILTDVPAKPFTIDVVFRGYALFRYLVDDGSRVENYFHKGDTIRIEANRKVLIWISDAGAFSGTLNATTDFQLGSPGQVVARRIEWSKDASGKTILVASPMD